jgi:hypothetical protein
MCVEDCIQDALPLLGVVAIVTLVAVASGCSNPVTCSPSLLGGAIFLGSAAVAVAIACGVSCASR